jgi:hypothetical protein
MDAAGWTPGPDFLGAETMNGPDSGLDLESFLLLLRADLGTWALLGAGTLALLLLVWMSWGSRRAFRRCLILSVAAHAGIALYGSTVPSVFRVLGHSPQDRDTRPHIRQIRVSPMIARPEVSKASTPGTTKADAAPNGASLDLAVEPLRLADAQLNATAAGSARPMDSPAPAAPAPLRREPLQVARATPARQLPAAAPVKDRGEAREVSGPAAPSVTVPSATELSQYVPVVEKLRESSKPVRSSIPASALDLLPKADLRSESIRPQLRARPAASSPSPRTEPPIPLARVTPGGAAPGRDASQLADLTGGTMGHNLTEVPLIYRSRLDSNRSAQAQKAGASTLSEQAVERALDWLARHQDSDGRWDGGTARYDDGTAVAGDDAFTVHCPAGQTCFGECAYWEADTALTGLALLTFLGAGYTQNEGKYATIVGKGLDFLLVQQKADGDLRGPSKAVGMYCHAMATLALCEAYALSLDDHLRDPAERAIAFMVRARARDGQAWRYLPGAPVGDTSILGWVVMAIKSARETGLPISGRDDVQRGTLLWLERVARGNGKGLACYQPGEQVTPTMTAEAWVCRQFLGVGGTGPASTEAAAYLLGHESDKGDSNFYYWYYGTLAMYQYGGPAWTRWNGRVRDRIVRLQRSTGHQIGSWDPDDSMYGARGGRLYCTALAALTLEVYYRYLRLYGAPNLPAETNDEADAGPALEAPRGNGSPAAAISP